MKRQPNSLVDGEKGITLLEILFSVFIAAMILIGVIEAILYLTALTTSNKTRTLVFHDVQVTMERIGGVSLSDLSTQFPNGAALSGSFVANVLGGYKLPSEVITVSYPSGITSNPREVRIIGQWNEKGQAKNVTMKTFRR